MVEQENPKVQFEYFVDIKEEINKEINKGRIQWNAGVTRLKNNINRWLLSENKWKWIQVWVQIYKHKIKSKYTI